MAEGGVTSIPTTGRDIDKIGEVMVTLSMACEAAAVADENSGYVTALEGGVLKSCNTNTAEEERRARSVWKRGRSCEGSVEARKSSRRQGHNPLGRRWLVHRPRPMVRRPPTWNASASRTNSNSSTLSRDTS